MSAPVRADSLRAVFAGRRGRLLTGLLLAEFAAAVQIVAYAAVLPIAARDLSGQRLYGATVTGTLMVTLLVLALGPAVYDRLRPRRTFVLATALYTVGILMAALAPAMGWILASSLLRGTASGLLLGLGLTAIGGLYEDALRPRVLGLFAIMWLLPSLAGPVLTSVVAVAAGWRWAVAWPVILVVAARLLVIRDAGLIPWERSTTPLAPGNALATVGGLLLASVASGLAGWWAAVLFVLGLVVAGWAGLRVLAGLVGEPVRLAVVRTFALLSLVFFGAETLLPLLVVEGLGYGVVASGVALGATLVAWSLTGLHTPRLADPARRGLVLIAVPVVVLATTTTYGGAAGLVVTVVAAGVAGFGMGLAYPRLMSQSFDGLTGSGAAPVASAVGFAEVAGTAVGALAGGGVYSLGVGAGLAATVTIPAAMIGFALVALLALRRRG